MELILEYLLPCPKPAWIKDGACDKNEAEFKMEACQFDGGDCCQKSLIGNGICEEVNNFATCGNFDGGDCKGKIYYFPSNIWLKCMIISIAPMRCHENRWIMENGNYSTIES